MSVSHNGFSCDQLAVLESTHQKSLRKVKKERRMNEARFSNIFIEKRASTCPQSLEKSRLFSYALLVSECENFQNMKRIFLRKVVI